MVAFLLAAFHTLTHLILTSTFDIETIIDHILQMAKQTQRGWVTSPSSQSYWGSESRFSPRLSEPVLLTMSILDSVSGGRKMLSWPPMIFTAHHLKLTLMNIRLSVFFLTQIVFLFETLTLRLWFSQCGPQTSNTSIPPEIVRNANSLPHPSQLNQKLENGTQ